MTSPRNLTTPGCPLCRVAWEAEQQHLTWFLLENYSSPPMLLTLARRRYCRAHAALLAADPQREQLSTTFRVLTDLELATLREFRARLEREPNGLARLFGARRVLPEDAQPADQPAGCPACESGALAARAELFQLLSLLATDNGRRAYQAHDGLCRPHLWLALREATDETAAWLAAESERKLAALREEFALYFHRLDYRYHDEPKGAEHSAWRRALWFFWGETSCADGEAER